MEQADAFQWFMTEPHMDLDTNLYFDLDLLQQQQPDLTPMPVKFPRSSDAVIDTREPEFRVSLACIPCRTRHVRCDATSPQCSRCQLAGRCCSYAKSRRGGQTKAQISQRREALNQVKQNYSKTPHSNYHRPTSNTVSASTTPGYSETSGSLGSLQDGGDPSKQNLLGLYYKFFHDAHPWGLPQRKLLEYLQADGESLRHLNLVLEYIGSLYTAHVKSETLRERIELELAPANLRADGFSVQALLLFSVATHCNDDFEHARMLLDQAISMALGIGMQHRIYATRNGNGDPILEECWRRTWWGVYVIDSIYSGILHMPDFQLSNIVTDVDMPCEEQEYENGVSSISRCSQNYSFHASAIF
jgi:hypothetical protein